jgi:hypothetical protein
MFYGPEQRRKFLQTYVLGAFFLALMSFKYLNMRKEASCFTAQGGHFDKML